MLFVERKPSPLLAPFVRLLWMARDPHAHRNAHRQRVLPTGWVEVLLNLAGDSLTDLSSTQPERSAPALVVGVHRTFQTIASEDIEDLVGFIVRPGGLYPLLGIPAHELSERETSLEAAIGPLAEQWRARLREVSPAERLPLLEHLLEERLRSADRPSRCPLTQLVLAELSLGTPIAEIVRRSGRGARYLNDAFRREVGVTPKIFHRIQRFQQAVRTLHLQREVRWAELALDCGFYDQAHFSHEFRAFSGISPTEYSASPRVWQNHLPLD